MDLNEASLPARVMLQYKGEKRSVASSLIMLLLIRWCEVEDTFFEY